jgi:small subunit ribosomal protein S13
VKHRDDHDKTLLRDDHDFIAGAPKGPRAPPRRIIERIATYVAGPRRGSENSRKKTMVYIFNKYIPPKKPIRTALTSIYGTGPKRALEITDDPCINPNLRFYRLKLTQISKICKSVAASHTVGSFSQKEIRENIRRSVRIRSYKGIRHKNCLPVRGQRTHTNAQTQKKFKRFGIEDSKA